MRAGMARPSQPLATATTPPPAPPALTAVDGDGRVASRIFDIPIELAQPADMLRTIASWVGTGEPHRVMYVNAHVVNESRAVPELRRALETADLVYCDGYGVRLAARVLEVPVPHRMTGADWVWGLAAMCEMAGSSLYLLGSDPPVARDAAKRLSRWYPDLRIAGAHHGYFDLDSPHNDRVIEDINARQPDIVLVGMGTPKQELWIERYGHRLDADVLWTVGALLDYIAGRVPRAPRWLADNGLEWIWRLAIEPHRMWRRYLLGNPKFLSRVFTERQRAHARDR
ncbi:MAG: N-acetylglucosaminyldiphosphoundecaprenol N-acetyl-beta-D-mannosaminyltransferase [Solirubrobacteraceae bacterium]|nr:N-acetylglucosaminyldiphosphoundecaprenol N-acetyl-beta-D-mannosaminyltransferase [Solirubrobacteraceae bacterium]